MIRTELTEIALNIAREAHSGQVDKGGEPYILHPLHVAEEMQTEECTVIALLHDVLEDSEFSASDLLEKGIPKELVVSVERLTRNRKMSYTAYITGLINSGDRQALTVKLADLNHNMDPDRKGSRFIPESMKKRYQSAKTRVEEALGQQEVIFE